MYRRRFLHTSLLGSLGLLVNKAHANADGQTPTVTGKPIVISTWGPNVKANAEAWTILGKGGRALDAVEAGVKITEADPSDMSVGYGGLPDRDGRVTLDACIMDEEANCGAVMCLEHIMHPISVARLVMEKTPHVQLVGDGALQFALANGFKKENLLTPEAEKVWRKWLKDSKYDPMIINDLLKDKGQQGNEPAPVPGMMFNHDTIGMIALDAKGNVSGACTTSGMAFKMHGRVGDSPIIGAGLYVDNEVGAATATGVGEEVVRICGSHTVVELMRQGMSPELACKNAVERMLRLRKGKAKDLQVGFIAINKKGEVGAYAIQKGFNYAVHSAAGAKVYDAKSLVG
ncbi:MAG TPA: N(4)-(beta-N-acetylglucosaminyl)-L-asparaginase [Chitinophagaceae bacterium]|nr:N(4)-(beta-N-acetylglucosaminyl)-L-asparaginase [Chitinophagaceae bacterium]